MGLEKDNELLRAINSTKCDYHSGRESTYRPGNSNKMPGLLHFSISRGFPTNQIKTQNICEPISDHIPVVVTLDVSPTFDKAFGTDIQDKQTSTAKVLSKYKSHVFPKGNLMSHEGTHSVFKPISDRVPQGSGLGPLALWRFQQQKYLEHFLMTQSV
ncbi:hypothetical protein Trydic_g9547 [Trypoxylus dichotomus]